MATLVENQRFERYRIVRWLGTGVSGESYEAEDTPLSRRVTLKLLSPYAPLSDAARRQFFREMQDSSQLNHPSIAPVLDYGEIGNQLYVARHYVSYGSLLGQEGREWFRAPLSISDALHYSYQLAQALDSIHRQSLVHGALTLSNILVTHQPAQEQDGQTSPFFLADAGLAQYVRRYGHPHITMLPATAAPEQYSNSISPTSDQFALATILYFWLAGRPPYLGTPQEIEQLKLTGTISPLFLLNPEVSLEQETVIRRALSTQPEERYPSVLAFAEALLATLSSSSLPDEESQISIDRDTEALQPAQSEHLSQIAPGVLLQIEPAITFEIDPHQPQPQPIPDPIPPAPDIPQPVPPPAPEPLPVPAPEPLPEPAPEPLPKPAPDPLPGPDIPSPMPQPEIPTIPQVDFSMEASKDAKLLITYAGNYDLWEFLLDQDEVSLGRAGSSDILLDQDELPSRHHAVIKREANSYVLYDLRSTLGVSVNGTQLESEVGYVLKENDQFTIGNYTLLFYLDTPSHRERDGDTEVTLSSNLVAI